MLVDKIEEQLISMIEDMKGKLPSRLPPEQDLCKRFGVSINTLRNALEPLKKQGLIESVRGRGNTVLRAPSSQKQISNTVLVIPENPNHPYNIISLSAIDNVLKENGLESVRIDADDVTPEVLKNYTGSGQVLGGILVGEFESSRLEEIMGFSDINLVLLGEVVSFSPIRGILSLDHVAFDRTNQAFMATEYLLKQGHKRIALAISNRYEDITEHRLRIWSHEIISGYVEALRRNGLEMRREYFVNLPGVTPFEPNNESVIQGYRNDINEVVSIWKNNSCAPTVMIHAEHSEAFLNDMLNMFLPGQISMNNMLGLMVQENLQTGFSGYSDTLAACNSIKDMVREALNSLIFRRDNGNETPARRVVLQESSLWQRRSGRWQQIGNNTDNQTNNEEKSNEQKEHVLVS